MAAYLAELSGTHLAALLLSTDRPDPRITQLTGATAAADLPALLVEHDIYQSLPGARSRPWSAGRRSGTDRARTDIIADALDRPGWSRSAACPARDD